MTNWPQISDERTLRRFAIGDQDFAALASRLAQRIGGQQFTDEHFARAINYPWHVTASVDGFLLRDGRVSNLGQVDESEQVRATDGRTRRGDEVHGLIAIGSNASPEALGEKLSALDPGEDQEVLAIAGSLSGVAVGHSPHLAIYGSLPATLFEHAGATTPVSLLLVTTSQLKALTQTEFNYLLARLPGDRFSGSLPVAADRPIYAYVSRHGVVVDESGAPLPLARPHQQELLDRVARVAIDESATAIDLVRRTIESYAWAVDEAKPRIAAIASPLDRSAWELHPGR